MISIGDFSTGVSFSAGGGVSGTPSDPSGSKWWDPTTWGSQEAGGMLLPPKPPAPAVTLPLASATGFTNTRLSALRSALSPSGVVIKRPVSDGSTLGPATAGTPAAPPTLDRAGRYYDEPPQRDAGGIPTAYLVGGAAVAAVAAFLVFRRKG